VYGRWYCRGLRPHEIEEAAHIDGAKPLRIMFRIIIPLSMPLIAILTLWTAVANWNEWFGAMIYTKGNDKLVLQLLLRRIIIDVDPAVMGEGALTGLTSQTSPETVKAASVIVTTAPIICFYPFLQKYFVKGIFIGSVKG
jgi:putative aldouronate transport system permease protein